MARDRDDDDRAPRDRPRADRPEARRRDRDDEDYDDRPRRKGGGGGSGVPCPECGSRNQRRGPMPWYLGTVGMMLCKPVECKDCGHEFDAKKPRANLASRKRNLAIILNGVGLLGIVLVIGCLGAMIMSMGQR